MNSDKSLPSAFATCAFFSQWIRFTSALTQDHFSQIQKTKKLPRGEWVLIIYFHSLSTTISARKRVTILIMVLIISFVFCWLPFHFWHIAKITGVNVSRYVCRSSLKSLNGTLDWILINYFFHKCPRTLIILFIKKCFDSFSHKISSHLTQMIVICFVMRPPYAGCIPVLQTETV